METPLSCGRMAGQWEKRTKAPWRHVRTSAAGSWLWQGRGVGSKPADWPLAWPGLLWGGAGKRGPHTHPEEGLLFSNICSLCEEKFSKILLQNWTMTEYKLTHVNSIYIICKIYYSFNLWTDISGFFFFFFSVFFALLICIFTWSCNLEKNAWDDFKALSLPSSCN